MKTENNIILSKKNLENTTSIKLENPIGNSVIHDQQIADVKFDRLIRIEIKWSSSFSGKRLCLAGLEIRKIGLLQPIQVLDEKEDSKYNFGCVSSGSKN